jgi:LDH2 family malate/lactate/ureidoglycolate dehydrogenase
MLVSLLAASAAILWRFDRLAELAGDPAKRIDRLVDGALQRMQGVDRDPTRSTARHDVTAPVEGDDSHRPAASRITRYFEILLKNGDVIIARAYQIEGEMIVYRTAHGDMGISKNKVKRIRFRDVNTP